MNSLERDYYSPPFSHIYIEKEVRGHFRTKRILEQFPDAITIEISHYKDVFCRRKQDVALQNQVPMLILAGKREPVLYPGSPVCQNFGEKNFYYTSCAMNCLYSCDYCYLKGMYPSGNLVIFVNLEDTFAKLEDLLREQGIYLCISYDTDLLALEGITGFVEEWLSFAGKHPQLTIECRTKCARTDFWERVTPKENAIFAFTLSPQKIIEGFEHKTPSLSNRLLAVRRAMEAGFPVRLCFDPMLYVPDWKEQYEAMVCRIGEAVDWKRIRDASVGSFRISQEYLKKLRKAMPMSAAVQFPFENENGFYHYPVGLMNEMEGFLLELLESRLLEDQIFRWKDMEHKYE